LKHALDFDFLRSLNALFGQTLRTRCGRLSSLLSFKRGLFSLSPDQRFLSLKLALLSLLNS
jgi:hypothetical protein